MLETITEVLKLVATYGLSIVLAVWFVFRIDVTITKLTNLLETFIKWQNDKETARVEKEKEMRDKVDEVKDMATEIINQLKIMEVRITQK